MFYNEMRKQKIISFCIERLTYLELWQVCLVYAGISTNIEIIEIIERCPLSEFWLFWTSWFCFITKTRLYNFDPLKPHFYTVKLGFMGVYIIFLISAQIKDCGYSLEPPHRGGSNEYPQSMFWAEI